MNVRVKQIPETSPSQTTRKAPRLDSDIDLLVYLVALIKARFLIIVMAIVCGLAALGYSYTLPELYEAYTRTDLVDIEDPGGVSPDNRRASEVSDPGGAWLCIEHSQRQLPGRDDGENAF